MDNSLSKASAIATACSTISVTVNSLLTSQAVVPCIAAKAKASRLVSPALTMPSKASTTGAAADSPFITYLNLAMITYPPLTVTHLQKQPVETDS